MVSNAKSNEMESMKKHEEKVRPTGWREWRLKASVIICDDAAGLCSQPPALPAPLWMPRCSYHLGWSSSVFPEASAQLPLTVTVRKQSQQSRFFFRRQTYRRCNSSLSWLGCSSWPCKDFSFPKKSSCAV